LWPRREPPQRPGLIEAVATPRSKVLLVKDDPAIRAALLGALEAAGFEAAGAADAAEALQVLAQYRVAVVVADHHLPAIAGLDGGAALGTSLILYSGRMTDEPAAEAQDFGVRVVLEKPVSAERLVEAVRGAMADG
jgi:DNA-binding NtrC family response regulator